MAIPRLALAVPVTSSEPSPASLGLLAGLTELGWRVQHFRARACPTGTRVVGQITGSPGRHLDAWLMPPDVCRTVFAAGPGMPTWPWWKGRSKIPTCLDRSTARTMVVPATLGRSSGRSTCRPSLWSSCPRWEGLHLPTLPPGIDAILIDQLEVAADYPRIADAIRVVCKKPVVGAVEALPAVREALAVIPRDQRVPDDLIAEPGPELPPVRQRRCDPDPGGEPPVSGGLAPP